MVRGKYCDWNDNDNERLKGIIMTLHVMTPSLVNIPLSFTVARCGTFKDLFLLNYLFSVVYMQIHYEVWEKRIEYIIHIYFYFSLRKKYLTQIVFFYSQKKGISYANGMHCPGPQLIRSPAQVCAQSFSSDPSPQSFSLSHTRLKRQY